MAPDKPTGVFCGRPNDSEALSGAWKLSETSSFGVIELEIDSLSFLGTVPQSLNLIHSAFNKDSLQQPFERKRELRKKKEKLSEADILSHFSLPFHFE